MIRDTPQLGGFSPGRPGTGTGMTQDRGIPETTWEWDDRGRPATTWMKAPVLFYSIRACHADLDSAWPTVGNGNGNGRAPPRPPEPGGERGMKTQWDRSNQNNLQMMQGSHAPAHIWPLIRNKHPRSKGSFWKFVPPCPRLQTLQLRQD